MNFLSQLANHSTTRLVTVAGIVLLVFLCVWLWKTFRLGKLLRSTGNKQSISAKSLEADQFVFDDDANELQSELEAELSKQDGHALVKSPTPSETSQQITGRYFAKKTRNTKQTKQAIGLASEARHETDPADSEQYTRIDKVELARLVSAVESLQRNNQIDNVPQPHSGANSNTTLIDAEEIERLSFHLESSKREIASLRQELASQTHRLGQIEKDTPDALLRDSHKKITLLANSIIQRNTTIDALAEDYKSNVALAAELAKSDPQQSQQRMQQCKVIKLQIKLQGQQLEKERLLMSEHTRIHQAMQLPRAARVATLMQLIEKTNEIKNQNSNLKLLVENINVEFAQLRKIVEGLKAGMGRKQTDLSAQSRSNSGLEKGLNHDLAEKRLAANDARIGGPGPVRRDS